ncbi:hypothetical protein PENDEC_c004G02443 [Penicillium decumbens]|uniref:Uncharacterized protein n=1 Tax=Penicillium decumbens TaxID=69771 RepID=A0A1V6PHZ5_PENDC|nr:hypothetical protein PENDEC_c004G02443 [Penicillium decumbens]
MDPEIGGQISKSPSSASLLNLSTQSPNPSHFQQSNITIDTTITMTEPNDDVCEEFAKLTQSLDQTVTYLLELKKQTRRLLKVLEAHAEGTERLKEQGEEDPANRSIQSSRIVTRDSKSITTAEFLNKDNNETILSDLMESEQTPGPIAAGENKRLPISDVRETAHPRTSQPPRTRMATPPRPRFYQNDQDARSDHSGGSRNESPAGNESPVRNGPPAGATLKKRAPSH